MKPQLSIIVPVYNGERLIRQCLDHLLDIINIFCEVIVINDGSTDRTSEILKEYAGKITIIEKKNGGVSSARNTGLHHAAGKYVTFSDVDDIIPKEAIVAYLSCIKEYPNVSCVQGCLDTEGAKNKKFLIPASQIAKICLGFPKTINEYPQIEKTVKASVHGCYGKLFLKSFLIEKNIFFDENIGLGEDLIFYFSVLQKIDNVLIIEDLTYQIMKYDNSETRKYNEKMPEYSIEFAKKIFSILEEKNDKELYDNMCYQINIHVNVAMKCCFLNDSYPYGTKNRYTQMKFFLSNQYINKAYCHLVYTKTDFAHKIKYFILKCRFVRLYCILHQYRSVQ